MKALRKSSLREIRKSLGRYLAILAIVALGVGFFCGLRVCRDAMVETGDDYLDRQSMYDYRLVSTVGFDQGDADAFADISGVTAAAGAVSQDALVDVTGLDMSGVVIFNSLTEDVNEISLTAGRLPRANNEAVADAQFFPVDSIARRSSFPRPTMKTRSICSPTANTPSSAWAIRLPPSTTSAAAPLLAPAQ